MMGMRWVRHDNSMRRAALVVSCIVSEEAVVTMADDAAVGVVGRTAEFLSVAAWLS